MAKPTVYAETLQRAAVAIGGEARLAETLDIPPAAARRWLAGEELPPVEVYQKALDLLIAVGTH